MASIVWIPVIFTVATIYLYFISVNLPDIDYKDSGLSSDDLKFPRDLKDLTSLAALLKLYKTDQLNYVLFLFCSAYIYKQTFAIPGSVFMNLLAGALFSVWYAFPLVCLLTASGATCCYLISKACGKKYLLKYFPEKVNFMQKKVQANMDSLLFFLLFLRFFPMSPNWFLNMASPIINVPIHLFFISVFVGLMPYNFICVQTGAMLTTIGSVNDIFTTWTMLKMAGIAFMALVPGILMNRLKAGRIKTDDADHSS